MKEFNLGDKFAMKGVNLEVCEFENSFDCDKRKDGKFVYFKEF